MLNDPLDAERSSVFDPPSVIEQWALRTSQRANAVVYSFVASGSCFSELPAVPRIALSLEVG